MNTMRPSLYAVCSQFLELVYLPFFKAKAPFMFTIKALFSTVCEEPGWCGGQRPAELWTLIRESASTELNISVGRMCHLSPE